MLTIKAKHLTTMYTNFKLKLSISTSSSNMKSMVVFAFLAVFCLAVSEAAPKDNQCGVRILENGTRCFQLSYIKKILQFLKCLFTSSKLIYQIFYLNRI